MTSNEFKAGDVVYASLWSGIEHLVLESTAEGEYYELMFATRRGAEYKLNPDGKTSSIHGRPIVVHATQENRQALVTLYGEDAVPKLSLSPQEMTLKLLQNQKYQLCKVSNHNNKEWQYNSIIKVIVHIGVFGEFLDSNGTGWTYGIPVDNNGNEITEISDGNNALCLK